MLTQITLKHTQEYTVSGARLSDTKWGTGEFRQLHEEKATTLSQEGKVELS